MRSRASLRRLLPVGLLVLVLAGVLVAPPARTTTPTATAWRPGIRVGGSTWAGWTSPTPGAPSTSAPSPRAAAT